MLSSGKDVTSQPQGVAPPTPTPRPHHATGEQPRKTAGYPAVSTRPKAHGGSDARPPCSHAPRGRAPATPGVLQLVAQQPAAELHPPRQNCRATDKACVPQHALETAISPLPLSADTGLRYSSPFAKTDGHPSVQSRERQNETSTVFIPGNYGR